MATDKAANFPTFGMVLRAARMRWYWSQKHGAFVRMMKVGDGARIELHPCGMLPSPKKHVPKEYVIWWDEPECLDMIAALRGVKSVSKPITFYVDGNGELLSGDP